MTWHERRKAMLHDGEQHLGLSVNGVKLIEQRALAKVRRALGVGT